MMTKSEKDNIAMRHIGQALGMLGKLFTSVHGNSLSPLFFCHFVSGCAESEFTQQLCHGLVL